MLLSFLCLPSLAQAYLPQAQDPLFIITYFDITYFPEIKVYIYGDHLGASLDSLNLVLSEDGREQKFINPG